jgi:pectinesterase
LHRAYPTAATTPQNMPFGYMFNRCQITGGSDAKTLLGRPWRIYASTIYLNWAKIRGRKAS